MLHHRIADEIAILIFAVDDDVVGIEMEPVRSGEIDQVKHTDLQADGDAGIKGLVEGLHRFVGIAEFLPADFDAEMRRRPLENPAREGTEGRDRQSVQLQEGQIDEKNAGTDAEGHRFTDLYPVIFQQVRCDAVLAMGGLMMFKIKNHGCPSGSGERSDGPGPFTSSSGVILKALAYFSSVPLSRFLKFSGFKWALIFRFGIPV